MIVLDASAAIELVLRSRRGTAVASELASNRVALHAPHLLDLEVANVLRRGEASGQLTKRRAREALGDFRDLAIVRYPHEPLLERIWQLRGNLTAYDAAYVALAEALDAPLVTCDSKLAAAPGHSARVHLTT